MKYETFTENFNGLSIDKMEETDEPTYVCPDCGHVFKQGEYDYNYDTALLDFVCPECGWEGNENYIEHEEEEEEE